MKVALALDIPFLFFDFEKEYKEAVVDQMLVEYKAGRTPNPDVMCNREVKFGAFYRFAKECGADAIATGHYRAGEKDQSYFLWAVPKDILQETLFPVGEMEKSVVRALARKLDLPVANKRDSQGVCFLGSISVEEFLKIEFGVRTGFARDENGQTVGTHDGVLLYTLGERIALHGAENGPWFVLKKDIKKNELVVGKSRIPSRIDEQALIKFESTNWFGEPDMVTGAQYRYRGPLVPGHIQGNAFVTTALLMEIPTPGQSIVFYDDGELIGGGIIASAMMPSEVVL